MLDPSPTSGLMSPGRCARQPKCGGSRRLGDDAGTRHWLKPSTSQHSPRFPTLKDALRPSNSGSSHMLTTQGAHPTATADLTQALCTATMAPQNANLRCRVSTPSQPRANLLTDGRQRGPSLHNPTGRFGQAHNTHLDCWELGL